MFAVCFAVNTNIYVAVQNLHEYSEIMNELIHLPQWLKVNKHSLNIGKHII